jgi:hypothetical protein
LPKVSASRQVPATNAEQAKCQRRDGAPCKDRQRRVIVGIALRRVVSHLVGGREEAQSSFPLGEHGHGCRLPEPGHDNANRYEPGG